jgi:hypothetical protein
MNPFGGGKKKKKFGISLQSENLDGDIPWIAFVYRVITMNPGFVSIGNIHEHLE